MTRTTTALFTALFIALFLAGFALAQEEVTSAKAADDADDAADDQGTTLAAPGGAPAGLAVPLVQTSSSSTSSVEETRTMTVRSSGPLPDCDTPECRDRRQCEADPFAKCWDDTHKKCVCIDGYKWSGTLDHCITEREWNERRAMQIAIGNSRANKEAIGAESARNDAQDETLADHDWVLRDHAEKLGDEIARGQIHDRKIDGLRRDVDDAKAKADGNELWLVNHEWRLGDVEGRPVPMIDIGLSGMFHARQGLGDPDEDDNIAVHRTGTAGYVMVDARFGALDPRTSVGVIGLVGAGLGPSVAADPDMMTAPAFMMYALGGPVIPLSRRVELGVLGGFSFEATDISNGDLFLSKSSNGVLGVELNVDLVGPVGVFVRFLGGGGIANDLYEDEENGGEVMHRAARTHYVGLQAGVRFGPRADPRPTPAVASAPAPAVTSTASSSSYIELIDLDEE